MVSSPPLDIICAPSPEFDTDADEDDGQDDVHSTTGQIRVYFVIIFSGYTNETFDEASQSKLVEALRNATKDLGARSHLDVTIKSIENLTTSKRRRVMSIIDPMSTGVRIHAEANFDTQDEDIAIQMMQLLTDSPSTVFPFQDFGEVDIPQIEIVNDDKATIFLPIILGILGGLVFCTIAAMIIIKTSKASYQRDGPETIQSNFQPYKEDTCHSTESSETMSFPQASLLQSISSREYSSSSHRHDKPGVVINNIGAGFL